MSQVVSSWLFNLMPFVSFCTNNFADKSHFEGVTQKIMKNGRTYPFMLPPSTVTVSPGKYGIGSGINISVEFGIEFMWI